MGRPDETLEAVAAEITTLRTKVHVDRNDPRPWAPSVNEATERRLDYLRQRRGELILFEVRRGHDPVDVAARARLDSADVARLLARTMRGQDDT